jgi:hypothetical protein
MQKRYLAREDEPSLDYESKAAEAVVFADSTLVRV